MISELKSSTANKEIIELLAKAPLDRSGESYYLLGLIYHKEKKYTEAMEAFQQAYAKGHVKATTMIGEMYEDNQSVPATVLPNERMKQAYYIFYLGAAKAGDAEAQYRFGAKQFQDVVAAEHEFSKAELDENYENAMTLLKQAADQGHMKALYLLGGMYESGKGMLSDTARARTKNQQSAVKHYTKAANAGHVEAQIRMGSLCMMGNEVIRVNLAKAAEWFRKAAEQENEIAQIRLIEIFMLNTQQVTEQEANKWLAKLGGEEKFSALQAKWRKNGILFAQPPADEKTQQRSSLSSIQKWAEQGAAEAQLILGHSYIAGEFKGMKLPNNKTEGVQWLHKAAASNNGSAYYALANCYAEGVGAPRDGRKAKEYLLKAVLLGHKEALFAFKSNLISSGDMQAALDFLAAELDEGNEPEEAQTSTPIEAKNEVLNSTTVLVNTLTTPKAYAKEKATWRRGLNTLLVRVSRLRASIEFQKDAQALAEIIKLANDIEEQFSHLESCIQGETVWPSLDTIKLKLAKEKAIEGRLCTLERRQKVWEERTEAQEAKKATTNIATDKTPPAALDAKENKQAPPATDGKILLAQLKVVLDELQEVLKQSQANEKDTSPRCLVNRSEALVGAITKTLEMVSYFTDKTFSNRFQSVGDNRAWQGRNFWWHNNGSRYTTQVDQLEALAKNIHEHVTLRFSKANTPGGKHKASNYLNDNLHPLLKTALNDSPDESDCQAQLIFYLNVIRTRVNDSSPLAKKAFERALGRAETLFVQLQREKPWAYRSTQQQQHAAIRWIGQQIRHPDPARTSEDWQRRFEEERTTILATFSEASMLSPSLSSPSSSSLASSSPTAPRRPPFQSSMCSIIGHISEIPSGFTWRHVENEKAVKIGVTTADEPHLNKIRDRLIAGGLSKEKGDVKKFRINGEKSGFSLEISKTGLVESGIFKKPKPPRVPPATQKQEASNKSLDPLDKSSRG